MGGGGEYFVGLAGTTSSDNAGTVIVAMDGARWKLVAHGIIDVKQLALGLMLLL